MFECPTCEDAFYYRGGLEEHVDDYDHWADCETCDRGFLSQHACNQHMNDKDHWAPRYECEMCTKEFLSQHAANRHMTAAGHWEPKIGCETCTKKFHTQGEANKHMNARGHYKHYCESCCIRFENANNLKMVRVSPALQLPNSCILHSLHPYGWVYDRYEYMNVHTIDLWTDV